MVNNLGRAVILDRLPDYPDADDPDDAYILAMALAGNADYLVTGDRRAGILRRGVIGRAKIMAPAAFCAERL